MIMDIYHPLCVAFLILCYWWFIQM